MDGDQQRRSDENIILGGGSDGEFSNVGRMRILYQAVGRMETSATLVGFEYYIRRWVGWRIQQRRSDLNIISGWRLQQHRSDENIKLGGGSDGEFSNVGRMRILY